MSHHCELMHGLCEFAELREYVRANADIDGLGGVLCTSVHHATHPLFAPIVQAAQAYQRRAWSLKEPDERPVQAWGIRVQPGVRVPRHSHPAQRYSVLYYLGCGAAIYVEGARIEIEAGLMLTFPGTAEHWTDEQLSGDRYSVACAFG